MAIVSSKKHHMIRLPKTVKRLFYNPKTDSISSLVDEIEKTHIEILKRTNLKKSTLTSVLVDDEELIDAFKIPEVGIKKKSILSEIANLFQGVSRWHSPNTMYNAAPPPLLPTVTAGVMTSLYNPNLALHTASGRSLVTEQKVIKAIANYVGWDRKNAGGVFTWGGKATTIYGIKLGVKNCAPESITQGLKGNIVVLSTEAGHPSHISDSEWLGIGSSNTIRLKTDKNNRVDLQEMDRVIRKVTKEDKKIAAIIISGGTTNDMVVDPIKAVVNLRDKLTKELCLKYIPHVHVDTVVAFPWIFFKDYDFKKNKLNIDDKSINRLSQILTNLKDLELADSFGIDFHKMGFCPYISSLFMVKEKRAFSSNENGYNWPFFYSMENSRPADGPNSAYVALNVLGVRGFQILIGHLTEIAVHLQDKIEETNVFEVINKTGLGTAVMFIPRLPDGILFKDSKNESAIRNSYTMEFINKLAALGNPFYIDKIPSNSTGANPFPYTSLKAYIISPFSSKKSNTEFVSFMVNLKKKIDQEFDFSKESLNNGFIEENHPLSKND
jgi:L-2,4-diaminobutyrate decarboxylase